MKKLKERWGIESNYQLVIILLVFSITGSLAVKLAKPVLHYFGADSLPLWLYWVIRILVIFPLYQIMLIFVGALLGQFRFFWNFEKKMLRRFGIKFEDPPVDS